MKLSADEIKYIQKIVGTAKLVGIDNIIIEPDLVRAIDDNKSVVLNQSENVPSMSFGSIGLNRLSVFTSRVDIAKTQDDFTLEATLDDKEEFVRSLTMKGKGVKIDYRCANPSIITAPKKVNDNPLWDVELNGEAVLLLQKGLTAMGAEEVAIISDGGVKFELRDVNGDVFSHTFSDGPDCVGSDDSGLFAHRYPAKTLLSLFRHDPDNHFIIGEKGTLTIKINGINVIVLPMV